MSKDEEKLEPVQPKDESATEKKPSVKAEKTEETADPVEKKSKPGLAAMVSLRSAKPSDMKGLAVKVGIALIIVLVLALITFGVLIYGYQSSTSLVRTVSGVVPYPVEKVNGSFVPYSEYLFEVDANQRAYQSNAKLNNQPAVDFNSTDGKKMMKEIQQHALEKLKSDVVVAQLAKQKKVTVSSKDVNELIDELYKRYGGKDTFLKTLKGIYGWDLDDLKKVVRKQLLAQKLEEKVTNDPAVDKQAKGKAQEVLGKVKAGGDFAELAKQNSQASDASAGGDLGTVTKGQLPEDMQKAIDALQPGQVSDLVKTQYGYEIIKVAEKTGDSAKVQHILIKTLDFSDYFNEQLGKAKVKAYIKIK